MAVKTATPKRKEAMAASFARGQKRKEQRNAANEERARANRARRDNGELTPWQEAKAARYNSADRQAKRAQWAKGSAKEKSESAAA